MIRYKEEFDIPDYDIRYHYKYKEDGRPFRGDDQLSASKAEESIQLADGRDHASDERT